VVRKIDTFRGDSSLGSWLYRIVANAAYEKLRGRARRRDEIALDEVLPPFDKDGRHAGPISDSPSGLHAERSTAIDARDARRIRRG
jgi:DNA-directed RNA polymerase specialized sigma24 family protein